MRALWSDRPNCSHNVSQKVKRIRCFSDLPNLLCNLATGKYGCREVRVYPTECGEQLGRDPSKNGSSKPLVSKGVFWGGNTLGLVPSCRPPTSPPPSNMSQEPSRSSSEKIVQMNFLFGGFWVVPFLLWSKSSGPCKMQPRSSGRAQPHRLEAIQL